MRVTSAVHWRHIGACLNSPTFPVSSLAYPACHFGMPWLSRSLSLHLPPPCLRFSRLALCPRKPFRAMRLEIDCMLNYMVFCWQRPWLFVNRSRLFRIKVTTYEWKCMGEKRSVISFCLVKPSSSHWLVLQCCYRPPELFQSIFGCRIGVHAAESLEVDASFKDLNGW